MKVVRLRGGIVVEVIPQYALPVEQWYGAEFAAECREAPEEVEQRWVWDGERFSPPTQMPAPEVPVMTTEDALVLAVVDLQAQMDEMRLGGPAT